MASSDGRWPDAARARQLLDNMDPPFDTNEAANGVFLPRNSNFPDDTAPNHLSIHTPRYYAELVRRLENVPKSMRREEIRKIAEELVNNTFPW